jgi:hypothetical protein
LLTLRGEASLKASFMQIQAHLADWRKRTAKGEGASHLVLRNKKGNTVVIRLSQAQVKETMNHLDLKIEEG